MYVMIALVLLLIIVVAIVILKPTQLDKTRRAADEIIMTRHAKPQDIKTIINDLFIFGLLDEITSDSRDEEKGFQDKIRKGETWDEAASSMISDDLDKAAKKAEKKDKERVDKLKALLNEIESSIKE